MATLILLILTGVAIYFAVTQLALPQKCPGCGRARVPRRTQCPFCGASYRAPRPQVRLPGRGAYLTGVQGPYQGRELSLPGGQFSIGRSPDNSLSLADPHVSPRHAVITPAPGGYVLYDQVGSSGTYVNGQRITQHFLRPGDQIQIGQSIFVFQGPKPAGVGVPSPAAPPLSWGEIQRGVRGLTTGRKISGSGALLALLCFFLPWIRMSCGVQITASGLDLATAPSQIGQPTWLLFLVPVMAIAVLWTLYSTLNQPQIRARIVATRELIFGAVGFLPTLVVYISFQNARNNPANLGLGYLFELMYGYWGTVLGWIGVIVGAWLDLKEQR